MKRLLSIDEAAEYTGFSVRYLRRLIFERRVAYHKDRKRVWFTPDDLDTYLVGLRVEPETQPYAGSRGRGMAGATTVRRTARVMPSGDRTSSGQRAPSGTPGASRK
jgi:excisionase family DNA binding protein